MKLKAIAVFASLLFAGIAHADGVQTNAGVAYIPDGSTVTSIQQVPGELPWADVVDFTFANGSGSVLTEGDSSGSITFNTPVSSLSFEGVGDFWVTDNLGDQFINSIDGADTTYTFLGPGITSIGWQVMDNGGLESMTYTTDPAFQTLALSDPPATNVPESYSLLFLGTGLIALSGLAYYKR